ncbi:2Fe-2S iron-sulfur cluster-binding protein [Pinisolibacter aquiterrae]|uniref:2Fe-2S iron-sulfur cluster-binding protein n=1 Tax=Pinisolibacter aquiterrae TaxID=2815579 RepID=UPI001C3DC720|nr:2Fe-2S iron-sulfur cluster-binding protein [Pinisolibacter aquiterrae]MBV5265013.1 2Fe-2S iron-sulfur cluster binding domain-containing protein [Pinisolibacter aquiterrae]MCC8235605.1 2Fe-2S iron-sulfur cluster-binding protein [Pinisolibacter aquiterrae]
MELLVRPLGRTIAVEPGANLLETLRANAVPISYSCMAGRCGVCRCKVVQGQVLSASGELRQPIIGENGQILACQTTLTGSCAIEIPEPDEVVVHPAKILKATVVEIRDETHDIRRLRLKTAKPLEYTPGQYATLQFTPDHIRPYSMAGIESDELLEFHVRLVPGGRVSPHVFETLKVGDAVRISGPLGASYLRRRHDGPMLLVAGGTGLAPVLSILRGAVAAGMTNPIHLYFGVRTTRDLYAVDRLAELAAAHPQLTVHQVIANGDAPAAMRRGLVTDAIAVDWSSLAGFRAYLCGAPPMVEAATILVKRLGLPIAHVYADAFYSTGY